MSDFRDRLEWFSKRLQTLPDKPEETAESTLRALWLKAAGCSVSAEGSESETIPELDGEQERRLDRLVRQRLEGIPLGHLTGRQMFMGIELMVGPDALLPRHETEILGRAAASLVEDMARSGCRPLVVDTCTGCGNVALALAGIGNEGRVVGVDLSPEAVELARLNAENLGLSDRVEFRVGDLLAPIEELAGGVDLITCNPPYISSANVPEMDEEIATHEPAMAFDGGPFGVKILRRLIKEAPAVLRPRGALAFEVGLGQGEPMSERLQKLDAYTSIETHRDETGSIRTIVARVV